MKRAVPDRQKSQRLVNACYAVPERCSGTPGLSRFAASTILSSFPADIDDVAGAHKLAADSGGASASTITPETLPIIGGAERVVRRPRCAGSVACLRGVAMFLLLGVSVLTSGTLSAQSTAERFDDPRGSTAPLAQSRTITTPVSQNGGTNGISKARVARGERNPVQLPEFETASVKPVDMNGEILNYLRLRPGGRLEIGGWELYALIKAAFRPDRLTGGADWTRVQKFNIQAVPPEEARATITDLRTSPFITDLHIRQMLQSLLIQRFALQFHYERVITDVYLLQRGDKPPSMRPASADSSKKDLAGAAAIGRDHGRWVLRTATMSDLARVLSDVLELPVLDDTGLAGSYDYEQRQVDVAPAAGQDAARLFLNLVTELRLKLRKAKRPVDVFVIDRAVRPLPD